jgi:hypothetical protein
MKSSMLTTRLTLLGLLLAFAGCASPPQARTTFLNSVDLVNMTDRMAESFVHDATIGTRQQHEQPWVISINRVVNHTNQIIPERERWLYLGRMRALLAQTDIAQQRNIIWIVPPERWPMIAEELGTSHEPYGLRMNPTHQLTAEFHALTLTSAGGRSDTYVCSFQLIDLGTGSLVWEDAWEVKHARSGLTFD